MSVASSSSSYVSPPKSKVAAALTSAAAAKKSGAVVYQLKGPESKGKDASGLPYKQTSSCGSFSRHRDWELSWSDPGLDKSKVNGFIVQMVTRTFSVQLCTDVENDVWVDLSGSAIDTYVSSHSSAYATVNTYWEAWEVVDGAALHADEFGLCPIVKDVDGDPTFTTSGTFVMTGNAAYYPGMDEATLKGLGFSALADHPANGLLATNSDPSLGSCVKFDAPEYKVTVTWSSRTNLKGKCGSKVESSGG